MKVPGLSYANVAATLALVFSLAGGAYAVGIGKNDVKSKNIAPKAVKTADLANGAVTNPKLGPNAVTTDKIGDGGVLAADLAAGQIAAAAASGGVNPDPYSVSQDLETVTLTTDRPGRLFVFGYVSANLSCDSGSCDDTYGLFVDQSPVPGTGSTLSADSVAPAERQDFALHGITTAPVPAGAHTIQLNFNQSSGLNISGQFNDARVGAILLGP